MKRFLNTLSAATLCILPALALSAPVNVNEASAEEIAQSLQGIGDAKAQAIVDHRKANGPFKSAEDLSSVKGIGTKTVEKNKEDIRL